MENLTTDVVLGGRVKLLQPKEGYRAAIDPVLLAAAVPARPGETVLDLGCGVGTAGLCLAVRVPDVVVTGLERDPQTAGLAIANVTANSLQDRMSVVEGDVKAPPRSISAQTYHHTMLNPPFGRPGSDRPPADRTRAAAMMEDDSTLAHWLRCAMARTRPGGTVVVIHRAARLADLLALGGTALGDLVVFPLWSRAEAPAKRVLVAGRMGSKAPLRLLPGLAMHDADGAYTAAANAVLRDAVGLTLWPGPVRRSHASPGG